MSSTHSFDPAKRSFASVPKALSFFGCDREWLATLTTNIHADNLLNSNDVQMLKEFCRSAPI
jgi:hypothetical protein